MWQMWRAWAGHWASAHQKCSARLRTIPEKVIARVPTSMRILSLHRWQRYAGSPRGLVIGWLKLKGTKARVRKASAVGRVSQNGQKGKTWPSSEGSLIRVGAPLMPSRKGWRSHKKLGQGRWTMRQDPWSIRDGVDQLYCGDKTAGMRLG